MRVPEHGLFAAMGLSLRDVIASLEELDQHGHIRFESQAEVIYLELAKV